MASGGCQGAWICDGGIDRVELMVIENVESLPTKLERLPFAYEKTLEQGYVEVRPEWVIQTVATRIAECQPSGQGKGRWIEKHRLSVELLNRGRAMWISDEIQEPSKTITIYTSSLIVSVI